MSGTTLAEATGLVLVLHRSLTWAPSHRGHWLRPAPSEVAPSYLLSFRGSVNYHHGEEHGGI